MRTLTLLALAGCTGLSPNGDSRRHADDDRQAVVGGQEATAGQFGHQVSVRSNDIHMCGGSVIGEHWVLTSADCVALAPNDISLELGATRLGAGRRSGVRDIILHPDYDRATGAHDIALVHSWYITNDAEPVRLMSEAAEPDFVGVGDEAVVSGWGAVVHQGRDQRDLQFANVLVRDPVVCSLVNGTETGDRICAGLEDTAASINGGIGTCEGDQGGAAVVVAGNSWAQIGVVNGASACDPTSEIPLNARVSSYADWIRSHVDDAEFIDPNALPGDPDDHGDTFADATNVDVDLLATVSGEIRWGDTDMFELNIVEARDILVLGTSDRVFNIRLMDGAGRELDVPGSFNNEGEWSVEFPRLEGVAYLEILGESSTDRGAYSFTVEGTPIPVDEHGDTPAEATEVELGEIVPSALNYEDVDVFAFEVTETMEVIITTTGETDTFGELVTDGIVVASNSYGGGLANFQIRATVAAGVHHVLVSGNSGEAGVGPYDFQVLAVAPDEHGDTFVDATLLPLETPLAGFLDVEDLDVFEVNVPSDGNLHLETAGSTDTLGELFNSEGLSLDQNDDGGVGYNFSISRQVTAGQYFVSVRHYNSSSSGAYEVAAYFTPDP